MEADPAQVALVVAKRQAPELTADCMVYRYGSLATSVDVVRKSQRSSSLACTLYSGSLSLASSFVILTLCLSSITISMILLFGLPLFLLPGSLIFHTFFPVCPLSLLCTCPDIYTGH